MHTQSANVTIHINESLDAAGLRSLESSLHDDPAVVSVNRNANRPHLMVVNFDSARARSGDILAQLRNRGLHAQLIGF